MMLIKTEGFLCGRDLSGVENGVDQPRVVTDTTKKPRTVDRLSALSGSSFYGMKGEIYFKIFRAFLSLIANRTGFSTDSK